jgi:hypothetical protein
MRNSLRAFCSTAAAVLLCPSALADGEIVIRDESQGCFHHENVERTFNRKGNLFVSSQDGKSIPEQSIRDLVSIIKASSKQTKFDPVAMGITPQATADNKQNMIKAAGTFFEIKPSVIRDHASLFEYPAVTKSVSYRLVMNDNSTTRVRFSVEIKDTTVSPEPITVTSTHDCPWMLPWTVTIGKSSWDTYSTALPLKLKALASTKGPNSYLLDGTKYWKVDIWRDPHFWFAAVGHKLHRLN